MSALAHALDYAAHGLPVLPIKPGEKRPPMAGWQNHATTDEPTIENWFTCLYADHGVGIATGGTIFALDIDVSDGKTGDETLADLELQYGRLPHTATVLTGSGGQHRYFLMPAGVTIRNNAATALGPGLDIRGEGGQCVAPPTIHPNGTAYEWDGGEIGEIAAAPQWLVGLLTARAEPSQPSQPSQHSDSDSVAARYNDHTTWSQLLSADGWTLAQTMDDGEQRWVRPGKDAREGISATVGHGGGGQMTVFSSSIAWLPEGSYSRFGYYACRHHQGDRSAAASRLYELDMAPVNALLESVPVTDITHDAGEDVPPLPQVDRVELAHLVDWQRFWEDDHSDEDWLAEPVIPRGRAIALYAPAKAGKSTIVLAVAAAVATGRRVLGHHRATPVEVLYLDYEMTQSDLQQRLLELGYGPSDDMSRLHYALLPSMPPLDTVDGARALLELVDTTKAELVVVDTFGRAVEGDEDSADTVRAFYRHTGLTLKARNVTYLRTDHSGKDTSKGQRGSSAKNDDVDLVWRLTRTDTKAGEGVKLERTHSRVAWVPQELQIKRVATDDGYDYLLDTDAQQYPNGTRQNAEILKANGIDGTGSARKAEDIMKKIKGPDGKRLVGRNQTRDAFKMLKGSAEKRDILNEIAPSQPRRRGEIEGGAVPRQQNGGAVALESGAVGAVKGDKGSQTGAVDTPSGAPVSESKWRGASDVVGAVHQDHQEEQEPEPDDDPNPDLPDLI
jgi:hypothetical protein